MPVYQTTPVDLSQAGPNEPHRMLCIFMVVADDVVVITKVCDSPGADNSNTGCGIHATDSLTYGSGFNGVGPGDKIELSIC